VPFALLRRAEDDPTAIGLDPAPYAFRTEHDYLFGKIHGARRPFLLVLGPKTEAANPTAIVTAYRESGCAAEGDLVFIGPGDETLIPQDPIIHSYGWLDRAEILGALRRCRGLIDVRDEGGITSVLEAWMSERAVVVQHANLALAGLITHSKNGLLVAGIDDLAAAMRWLLTAPDEAGKMGMHGRATAMRFAWSEIVKRLLSRSPG
jgi:glycosyltransferase involved in cell wall biosynthesis